MGARRDRGLSRSEILTAALRIVDEEGADGLSMRRLARDLGIEAMSLYHHFPNKDAIIEGVIELSLSAQAPPPAAAPPSDWKDPVIAAVVGFRRALVAHPNVLPLMAAHPPVSTNTGVYVEGPLRYLIAQGFSDEDAAKIFSAVFALSFGNALLAASYGSIALPGSPIVTFDEESFAETIEIILKGTQDRRETGSEHKARPPDFPEDLAVT